MDPEELIKLAIKIIEDGFAKMGGTIKNPKLVDRYLLVSTYKCYKFYKSIDILCSSGYTDESMPILRSLIEHVINIRWILNKDTNKRIKVFVLNDLGDRGFGANWTNVTLLDRMREIGFKDRIYYDFCVKVTYSYAHVNSSSLNWYEVYDDKGLTERRWSSEAIYPIIAQMFGHVIKALGDRYKGFFESPNIIWNSIKVDHNFKEKYERMRKKSNHRI